MEKPPSDAEKRRLPRSGGGDDTDASRANTQPPRARVDADASTDRSTARSATPDGARSTSARTEEPPPFPYQVELADGSAIPAHGSVRVLADHVARHALEQPARDAFLWSHPWLRGIDIFASDAAARRFLRKRESDPSFATVASSYTRCLAASLAEASALGWEVRVDRSTTVSFDSTGLLILVGGGILRTAFYPGIDHVAKDIAKRRESRQERAAREARERRWTDDERHYYRVFRPALRTIRRFPVSGTRGDAQYGALKRVLPAIADLGLGAWRAMRARRPGEADA